MRKNFRRAKCLENCNAAVMLSHNMILSVPLNLNESFESKILSLSYKSRSILTKTGGLYSQSPANIFTLTFTCDWHFYY